MPFIAPLRSAFLLLLLGICGLSSCEEGEVTPPTPAPAKKDTCLVAKATETRTGLSPGTTPMIFEYDAQKRLIKKRYPTLEGDVENSISFEYDATGKLIKAVSVGIPPNTYTEQFQYDTQGRLTKSIRQYGTYSTTSTMTYDSSGNRTRMDVEYSDGRKEYTTYAYANGNMTESRYYADNTETIYRYEYYLDKANPVKVDLVPLYNLSAGNKNLVQVIRTTSTLLGDINFTYEFTDKGYLAKVNVVSPAYNTTSVYEYNCD